MRPHLTLAMLALLLPSAASAAGMTAADLVAMCRSKDKVDTETCKGYIFGVNEGLWLASDVLKDKTHFCLPGDIGPVQMVDAFMTNMGAVEKQSPKDMALPAASMIAATMEHTYPCAKAK